MIGAVGDTIVEINWITNPFRAEKFAAIWLPAAEAVLDFGATGWAFIRSTDDPQHFVQLEMSHTVLTLQDSFHRMRWRCGDVFAVIS